MGLYSGIIVIQADHKGRGYQGGIETRSEGRAGNNREGRLTDDPRLRWRGSLDDINQVGRPPQRRCAKPNINE